MTKMELYQKLNEEMKKAAYNSGAAETEKEAAYEDGYADGIIKAMQLLLELEA